MPNKFYITTPIYYVNDKPHIGHAYTTIAADVLARYCRGQRMEVFFLAGTDEHGVKIAQAAQKQGKSPKEFCDEQSEKFKEAWQALHISYDYFIRTTDEKHERIAKLFLQKLYDKGFIYKGIYKGLYCVGCEAYKTESDLVDGLCPDHKKAPILLEEENYFFKLSAFNDKLKTLIESDELSVEPVSRKNEMLGLLKEGLQDLAISRKNVPWGIPLPFDAGQTAYVWIEALMNYVTAIDIFENEKRFSQWWPADVHLMAKDIVKFHALIWPAMLLAIGEKPPKQVFGHGFFTVDGQKMSKTVGNVIDPVELNAKYGADAVRYLLLSECGFGEDGDISFQRFALRYQSELAGGIGNLVSRVFALSEKQRSFKLDFSSPDGFDAATHKLWEHYDGRMKSLKFHEILRGVQDYATFCDRYIENAKPWGLDKTDPARLKQVLSNLLEAIGHIANALSPFMPEASEIILQSLPRAEGEGWGRYKGEEKKKKIAPLFPRIEG